MYRGDLNNKQLQLLGRFASAIPLALALLALDRDPRSPFSVRPRRQQEDSCDFYSLQLVICL